MQDNGTSVHWHGVRQWHSADQDGTNGITECPIAPGDTRTYKFQVTQYGSSLYHSHFSAQYGDGIVGPIVFEGPASANYDVDLGPYTINEWYYLTSWQVASLSTAALQGKGLPPQADTMIINGTGTNADGDGTHNKVKIQKGKRYLLRLINIGVDNYIRVSLDSHQLQVIAADFVPIVPYYTETLLIGAGQRYDVIIDANQIRGNYWFRADVATACFSTNHHNATAIWTYEGAGEDLPTTSPYHFPFDCSEPQAMMPIVYQPVPSENLYSGFKELDVNFTNQVIVPGGDSITVWAINSVAINVDWDKPTLQYVMEGNTSYPDDLTIFPTISEGGWNYWLIQQSAAVPKVPHPIHLHGHDFFILGQGYGLFNVNNVSLNYDTPARRDTASVYGGGGGGWLALAFESNNPGAWLMHCHIARHISASLGVQFLESPSLIPLPNQSSFEQACASWKAYSKTAYWKKEDSGL
ncbi:uncharacterized protein A1O9_02199 [Exophiala aquamarina CBS 119918]|uniref:laccase n=1 Tax=Exophiala aquamarina CBS 119918 TaxID=1182545 RepID=A0A072PMR6_9EURO|nr:uncharacterized protein A1O9_02199 [Exophiala aquamarina CBS 119918]KEF60638.1 hypothetical protein A1O9_02199 [Exophiala aquamarina CBS 119918]